jgi:hypothetical protein
MKKYWHRYGGMHQRQESRCFPCIHALWWTTGDHLLCNVVPFGFVSAQNTAVSVCQQSQKIQLRAQVFNFIIISRYSGEFTT